MSNLTDGKKALAAGKFAIAETKLIKALDAKPDDSELWWCLMLCRSGYSCDAALVEGLKEKVENAAKEGGKFPDTPFSSPYCQNALKYAADGKRRAFIDRVNAELTELWREKTGKTVALKTKEKKLAEKHVVYSRFCYAVLALAAVGAVVTVYGVLKNAVLITAVGAILFAAGIATDTVLRFLAKRAGKAPKGVLVADVALVTVTGIALLVVGMFGGSAATVRVASVMIVGAAVVAATMLFMRTRRRALEGRAARGNADTRRSGNKYRPEYDRARLAARLDKNGQNAKKSHKKHNSEDRAENEYKDTFD